MPTTEPTPDAATSPSKRTHGFDSVAERLPLSSSRMIRTMRRAAPSSRVVSAAASS